MICIKLGFLKKTQGRKYCRFYKHHLGGKKMVWNILLQVLFLQGHILLPLGFLEGFNWVDSLKLNGLNSAEPPNSLILFLNSRFSHTYLAILYFSFRYYMPSCSLKWPCDVRLDYGIITYRLQLTALESAHQVPHLASTHAIVDHTYEIPPAGVNPASI